MDTRADVIRLCMGLPDSYEDYPLTIPTGRPCATRPTTRPMLFSERQGICGLT
ncbi:hypothetical protein NIA69_12430 [Gemmiger formicilis]|nr:hypothetical protein [Gemmiger formicilis]